MRPPDHPRAEPDPPARADDPAPARLYASCPICTYNLAGLVGTAPSVTCPECGTHHASADLSLRPEMPPLRRMIVPVLLPSAWTFGASAFGGALEAPVFVDVPSAGLFGTMMPIAVAAWPFVGAWTVGVAVLGLQGCEVPPRRRMAAAALMALAFGLTAVLPLTIEIGTAAGEAIRILLGF